ncbi:MAG TPA: hypothetical protein VIO58_09335, partial [Candidatus Methanoperedens sp.]
SSDVMATAAHCYEELVGAGKVDCIYDIYSPCAPCDKCRTLVNHRVPDFTGVVVTSIAGTDKLTAQVVFKFLNSFLINFDHNYIPFSICSSPDGLFCVLRLNSEEG